MFGRHIGRTIGSDACDIEKKYTDMYILFFHSTCHVYNVHMQTELQKYISRWTTVIAHVPSEATELQKYISRCPLVWYFEGTNRKKRTWYAIKCTFRGRIIGGYKLWYCPGSNNSLKLLFICKIHAIGKATDRIWHNERKIILLEIFVRSWRCQHASIRLLVPNLQLSS